MRIAVTYDEGNVFQHFGRTEKFKVYDIEDGIVASSEIVDPEGIGHEDLAGFLADKGVDAVICGGLGQDAKDALAEAGVEVCAGASGSADEAVAAYLAGELRDTGVNCDHHHEGHHHEGCHHHHSHDDGGCAGCGEEAGCAGCPGCGEPMYMFEGKNVGRRVRVHYVGTFDDGERFVTSYDADEPLEFVCGMGMMLKGFDMAVAELEPGEKTKIHLEPEDAYGMPDPRRIISVERSTVEGSEDVEKGEKVILQDQLGRPFEAVVTEVDDKSVTFDCNHSLAGKALNFAIELLEVL